MKKLTFLAISLLVSLVTMGQQAVTIPEGVTPEEYTLEITHALPTESGNVPQSKKITALVAFDGSDVYLQGLAYYFPDAYVKGWLSDGSVMAKDLIIVPTGQYLGADMYGAEYLLGYILNDQQQMVTKDIIFKYDATAKTITYDPSVNVAEIGEPDPETGSVNTYAFLASAKYTIGGLPPLVPVDVPEGLETASYLLTGNRAMNEQQDDGSSEMVVKYYETPVKVGFNGDDVYMQGLIENVPKAWAKGTKNAYDYWVIPQGQYIGTWSYMGLTYNYFLSAISKTGSTLSNVSFKFDGSKFTTSQVVAATGTADQADAYFTLSNIKILKVEEREATPKQPTMTLTKEKSPYGSTTWYYADMFITLMDTEGLPMNSDKVSYVFYADKGDDNITPVTFPKSKYYMLEEDITEIPYNFTDKLDISRNTVYFDKLGASELDTWKRVGLQTIYRGNGVEHRSEILWVKGWSADTGISTTLSDRRNGSEAIYNLNGQRLDRSAATKGLYIVNGRKMVIK